MNNNRKKLLYCFQSDVSLARFCLLKPSFLRQFGQFLLEIGAVISQRRRRRRRRRRSDCVSCTSSSKPEEASLPILKNNHNCLFEKNIIIRQRTHTPTRGFFVPHTYIYLYVCVANGRYMGTRLLK